MPLPPSMFGGDGDEGDYDDNPAIDPALFEDAGGSLSDFHDAMQEYAEGSGFSAQEWEDMIVDIRDVYYDDEGNLHFTFDFEMYDEDTDTGYTGTRFV